MSAAAPIADDPRRLDGVIQSVDWILRRLVEMRGRFPDRAADLGARIDEALDERLRLMRLRDAGATETKGA